MSIPSGAGAAVTGGAATQPTVAERDAQITRELLALVDFEEGDMQRFLERHGAALELGLDRELVATVASLRRLCTSPRVNVRTTALAALARMPVSFVPSDVFLPALDDSDARGRRAAVLGLSRRRSDSDWRRLRRLAADTDAEVRAGVAAALASSGDPEALASLGAFLEDPSDAVLAAAAGGLKRTITSELPPALAAACTSPNPVARRAAARVLAESRADVVFPRLVGLAQDESWQVRREALRGLAFVGGAGAEEARTILETVAHDSGRTRPERFEALQSLAVSRAAPSLDRLATVAGSDADPVLRLAAARALLARGDVRGIEPLVELLEVATSPIADADDCGFVARSAAATLRAATNATPRDDSRAEWRKLLPLLVKYWSDRGRPGLAEPLVRSW